MLQTIREYTQGWIAGTIITIIILSFALWGIHSYFIGGTNNTNVAEVNGVEITKEQLAVAYERLRRQVQLQYGATRSITAKEETALKTRSLQALIDTEVLKQASYAQGYRVSNRQIDNYLQSMQEFQIDGHFSLERFQEILASTLLSTSEFLELIRTSLLVSQPKLGIIFTSFALPDETTYIISLVNQARDISFINIPLQTFLTQPLTIPSEKIKAYYKEHTKEFLTPDQVNIDYIELSLKELAAKIVPTDIMLKNFYNENINSYTQPMQWKFSILELPLSATATVDEQKKAKQNAEAVLAALRNGSDLNAVATQYKGSVIAENWMSLNQIPAELQKTVTSLNKPGQFSEPFKTEKGIAIIKLVDIQEPKIQSYDEVKDKVKETYVRQHAEEKFAELRDQLADLTYEHPDSLQMAAKSLNLPIITSELFSKEKGGTDISQYKKVRDVAFSNDVINLQNNSDVIQINPETVIVLRVKSHISSTLLPLTAISKQIEDKLKTEEAEAQLAQFAKSLQTQLQAGADPKKIAADNHLTWTEAGVIGRYSTKVDSAILDLAFRLPNPQTLKTKTVYGVTRLPNGYAIVALNAVKKGTVTNSKDQAVFAEQIQNSEGVLEYELYKQSQVNKAKINIM